MMIIILPVGAIHRGLDNTIQEAHILCRCLAVEVSNWRWRRWLHLL